MNSRAGRQWGRLGLATAAAALSLTAACGTTVSGVSATSSGATTGLSAEGLSAGVQPLTAPTTAAIPTGPSGSVAAGGVTGAGVPGGSVPAAGPSTAAGGPPAPGLSATGSGPLTIGIAVISDYNTIGAFGASINTPTQAQYEHEFNAIVHYLNDHGGIAGRQVKVLYQGVKFLTGSDYESQAQSMCNYFTQDHHVFAVLMMVDGESPLLPTCLARAHTIMLDGANSVYLGDNQTASYGDYYYRLNALPFQSFGTYIDELVRTGFLTSSDKIGLLRYDLPQQQDADRQIIQPALARHGLHLTDEFEYSYLNASTDLSSTSSQSSNAVLRFRAKGINRVLLMASQGPIPFTFMPVAQSQAYNPRYALTSEDLPYFLTQNVPAQQLSGAVGLGFDKSEDVGPQDWSDPVWKTCFSIVRRTDVPKPQLAAFDCDRLFFLKAMLDAAGAISAPAMRAAAARLGSKFATAAQFGISLPPGRNEGVSGYRVISYQPGCACFAYTSPVRTIP